MKVLNREFKNLRSLKADPAWKLKTRNFLVSQIENTALEQEQGYFEIIQNMLERIFQPLAQPVGLVLFLVIALFGGGVFFSGGAKPGDSLYIAKIINEKAQFALTFRDDKKIKLSLTFAQNRTKEISQVLEELDLKTQEKDKKVARLTKELKTEIYRVKALDAAKSAPEKLAVVNQQFNENLDQDQDQEVQVFSANLGRDKNGVQVSDSSANFYRALDEAEAFIDNQNYKETLTKLAEAQDLIENSGKYVNIEVDNLELLQPEAGTSTPENTLENEMADTVGASSTINQK